MTAPWYTPSAGEQLILNNPTDGSGYLPKPPADAPAGAVPAVQADHSVQWVAGVQVIQL